MRIAEACRAVAVARIRCPVLTAAPMSSPQLVDLPPRHEHVLVALSARPRGFKAGLVDAAGYRQVGPRYVAVGGRAEQE